MRTTFCVLLASAMAAFGPSPVLAADFKVIANSSLKVSLISTADVADVFLLTRTSLGDSGHVEPVLIKGGPAHETFLQQFIRKNDAALWAYYRSIVFTGQGFMPKSFSSDAEVASYVAKTKGAIGYVSANARTDAVKVLRVVSKGDN